MLQNSWVLLGIAQGGWGAWASFYPDGKVKILNEDEYNTEYERLQALSLNKNTKK